MHLFFCWLKGRRFVLLLYHNFKTPEFSGWEKKNAPLYIHWKKHIKIPSRKQGKNILKRVMQKETEVLRSMGETFKLRNKQKNSTLNSEHLFAPIKRAKSV